jgi:hypothetical protein
VVLPAAAAGRRARDGHELRAARPARAQGEGAAGRGTRRPVDHPELGPPDGHDWGWTGAEDAWNELRTLSPCTPACATRGSTQWAASSGRATTRTTRASCSCTRGCGRTRCRATARRSCRSSTIRRSTASTTTPDPAHHGPPARLVQHGRPVSGLHVAAAARRVARHLPGGRGRDRRRRRRAGVRDVAARSDRGPIRIDESLRPGLTFMTLTSRTRSRRTCSRSTRGIRSRALPSSRPRRSASRSCRPPNPSPEGLAGRGTPSVQSSGPFVDWNPRRSI